MDDRDHDLLYHRSKLIWGEDFQDALFSKHVIIFGLGGVGAYAVEALARSGVGLISIVDFDVVTITNFNRQLLATSENLGCLKTQLMEKRILSINHEIKVISHSLFYDGSQNDEIFNKFPVDFVIDAIDSVPSKLKLIKYSLDNQINIISSMGTGNRMDPAQLFITDISHTAGNGCPLAKKMRLMLKKINITTGLTVLTSAENPIKPDCNVESVEECQNRKHPPGSTPFVPPVAGIMLANYVVSKFSFSKGC